MYSNQYSQNCNIHQVQCKGEYKVPKIKIISIIQKTNQVDENEFERKMREIINPDHQQQFDFILLPKYDIAQEFIPFRYRDNWEINENYSCLKQIFSYQQVRGNGNCFYTAFIYQYFHYLFLKASIEEVELAKSLLLIKQIKHYRIKHPLDYWTYFTKSEIEDSFSATFEKRLSKHSMDKIYFEQLFARSDPDFYHKSIIIFRNLCYEIFQQQKEQEPFKYLIEKNLIDIIEDELLTWGKECNHNDIIVAMLSKYLNIQINLFSILPNKAIVISYQNYSKCQVNLIFRPGHYCIANLQ